MACLTVGFAAGWATPLPAMIFWSTADPNYNTTAPTGVLAGSGWQWVGRWGDFQGTAIGPHHFLTAQHVGGKVGDTFVFNGVNFTTTAYADDPASDLRIWEVSGTFPEWAPLYRASNELGKPLVVFGRGRTRGNEVLVSGAVKGWQWGGYDGQLRWGQNTVAQLANGGALLYAQLDASGGANEAHLALNDSSGPIFIKEGADWKLAGVAYAVDAYFSTSSSGPGFNAAIYDARGLYIGHDQTSGPWNFMQGPSPVPSGFYATRVSLRLAWIDSVIQPLPVGADAPLLTDWQTCVLLGLLTGTGTWHLCRGLPRSHEI